MLFFICIYYFWNLNQAIYPHFFLPYITDLSKKTLSYTAKAYTHPFYC